MSLPTSVKVGAHQVQVVYKSRLDGTDAEQVVNGSFDPDTYVIELRSGLAPSRMAEVMLHEVLHAVNDQTVFVEDEDEERVVTVLAAYLTKFAQDNPDFIRSWLHHALK